MSNVNVKSVMKETTLSDIPDGDYSGFWGGYKVALMVGDNLFELDIDNGVRGIAVPCLITKRGDKVAVEAERLR